MNVLVLCHANRWRSPLVHGYLELLAWAARLPHHPPEKRSMQLNFRSAGFKEAGRPAGKPMRDVAVELGFNLDEHRSRVISIEDVAWADLILHMGAGNLQRLELFVVDNELGLLEQRTKIRNLGHYCTPRRNNIQDFAFLKRDTEQFDTVVRYVVKACEKLFAEVIVPRAIEEQAK